MEQVLQTASAPTLTVIGDPEVGKRSLVEQVARGAEKKGTSILSAQLTMQKLKIDDMDANVLLYEIPDKHGYMKLHPLYIQGTDGVIVVADATKPSSIEHMMDWAGAVRRAVGDVPLAFVANKADDVNASTFTFVQDQLSRTAQVYDAQYFMVSAKMGKEIDAPFRTILMQIRDYRELIDGYANSGLKRDKIRNVIKELIRSEINEIDRQIKLIYRKNASPDKLFDIGKKISAAEKKARALIDSPSLQELKRLRKELEEASVKT